jgi:cell division protein FtsX
VHDLDDRLERLAAEATRDVLAPELAAVARRGRRRRRRQLAGSAALVAAVVAAGLVLPARLAGRSPAAARPDPAPPPATSVAGADWLGGYWFGKTDASVYLEEQVTAAEREAVRKRISALAVVDELYYESKAEAYARFKELYRTRPEMMGNTDSSALPESFRVRLDAPENYQQLQQALCLRPPRKPFGHASCMDGIDTVVEDRTLLQSMLVAKPWLATSDATVLLPPGSTDAQRQAIQGRLATIDGIAKVTYETPAEGFRRLPDKLRTGANYREAPILTWKSVPAAFRVTLDEPARVREFHLALCGSRQTGACGGLVVLEHPRK